MTGKPRQRVPAGSRIVSSSSAQPSKPTASYLRNEPGTHLSISMPAPTLRDRSEDIRAAWWTANSRANDAILNNGWIAGVVEQIISLMIGTELRLNYKPDGSVLGWSPEQTAAYARDVERRWGIWGSQKWECDAGGRYTMGQLQAAAVRQWFGTGEIVADLPFIARAGCETATKVRLLPSHWLSQRSDPFNRLHHGVRLDAHGAPASYLFEPRFASGQFVPVEKPARDAYGRPKIIHVFDGVATQTRGITPLAAALKITRQFDQLTDATLTAAMIHAIFAATVESDYPTGEVMAALQDEEEATSRARDPNDPANLAGAFEAFIGQKLAWNKNVNIDLGRHGKIAHMMLGEKLKLHGSEHPNSTFEAFANFLLREIASCLGVMFEDLTGDYRGATYSSIRMGIAKKWPLMEYRRRHIAGIGFTQPVFEAWLEEEIDSNRIVIPGGIDSFVRFRTSLCRCDWRGPAKPQADDLKAARAHEVWAGLGVMSQEMICNDLGVDHEDVAEQLAREMANRKRLGLPEPNGLIGHNGGPPVDDPEDDRPQPVRENA